jgi:hypothetical protein
MKNIIYQYWKGPLKPGVLYSTKLMKEYADRIGAEYRFDHNVTIASKTVDVDIYYEPANPLIDTSFDEYDNVALVDIDVFPVEGLTENLFDQLTDEDAGICTEPKQPIYRELYNVAGINTANDKKWAAALKKKWGVEYSYDKKNRPMVYNTGVVVISKKGLQKIRETWPSFQDYVNEMRKHSLPRFYSFFQDYFSAFIHKNDFKFNPMHNGWNSYMHKLGSKPTARVNDTRTKETKLVHIMFRTADDWPEDVLWRVTNSSEEEWDLPVPNGWPND